MADRARFVRLHQGEQPIALVFWQIAEQVSRVGRIHLFEDVGGALIVDTPGLRAVGMWDSADGLDQAFSDVAELAEGCRFRDCTHRDEPGCAVVAAVEAGELQSRRLENYRELMAEVRHVTEQLDVRAREERKRQDKQLARDIKRYFKEGHKS